MKKILVICSAGISGMILAKKLNTFFKNLNKEVKVDFTVGEIFINSNGNDFYDMYILSPQIKYLYGSIEKLINCKDKIIKISSDDYSIDDLKITKITNLVMNKFKKEGLNG
ncbi:MAG: hypothetical protein SOZ89_03790 [Peptoniphilaceae bacterium]|nr:hypothetical protein [Peptoniphilaceae bacterium]MDD7382813.1 hypothetical protein [Peptoniphilaceae bacterium]MDY3738227.1 hypothetical protein [Peptoniphilaceae bacterium]